jgi:trimethylamine:corrinoid methyltransferase-like protein
MTANSQVQPDLAVLDEAQIEQVHAYSLRILSTVGASTRNGPGSDSHGRPAPAPSTATGCASHQS